MSEHFIQILLYLFRHYMADELLQPADPESLMTELDEAGFSTKMSRQVIDWLVGSNVNNAVLDAKPTESMRIYTAAECIKMDQKVRGFLLFLEQNGMLDAVYRERIIDRAMALKDSKVTFTELHFLIRLLLINDGVQTEAEKQTYELFFAEGSIH